jgi:hypothetical protein
MSASAILIFTVKETSFELTFSDDYCGTAMLDEHNQGWSSRRVDRRMRRLIDHKYGQLKVRHLPTASALHIIPRDFGMIPSTAANAILYDKHVPVEEEFSHVVERLIRCASESQVRPWR